jgi:hypothetical protein
MKKSITCQIEEIQNFIPTIQRTMTSNLSDNSNTEVLVAKVAAEKVKQVKSQLL